ncbi:DUF3592 domain-containing protein [Dechloromonas sp. ZY10]|uniref:DUF3592 domain-containing protein n=1 Tax=Dechloromonas aquae TaxID=2664436 RepID=UPI00352833C1
MPRRSGSLWPIYALGGACCLLALAALILVLWQIGQSLRAERWIAHPAELIEQHASIAPGIGLRRDLSRQAGRYRYQWAGREYYGEQLSFSFARSSNFDDWDAELAEQLGAPGESFMLWVNPNDPAESVVRRDIRWGEIGAALFLVAGFGGGGGVLLAAAGQRGPRQRRAGPPRVNGRTLLLMSGLLPLFALFAWLLWRDNHPFWAVLAGLQPLLTLNAWRIWWPQR